MVQTCVVHVIGNAMRFVSYKDRKKVAASMREIYSAPTPEAAELALKAFDDAFGAQYPGAVDTWKLAWNDFIPFLDYPVELRKIVYTTNAIESINFQLRKITKNRGHFPDKDAAMKMLYLGSAEHFEHERRLLRHRNTQLDNRIELAVPTIPRTLDPVKIRVLDCARR